MANSTYINVVNRILQQAGQVAIPDNTTFNTNSSLEKIQLQAKLFVDTAYRRMIRKNRTRFTKRKYTLTTSNGVNSYALTGGATSQPNVTIEQIEEDSMFNTTVPYAFGPMKHLKYEKWMSIFPQGETTKAAPIRWIDLPPQDDGVERIAFSPVPNAAYTIVFNYFEDPVVLANATDVIQIPAKFEDILWHYGQTYVEIMLAEGKAGDFASLLQEMDSEIRQLTAGSIEDPPAVDIGITFRGGPQRRARRSARSYP